MPPAAEAPRSTARTIHSRRTFRDRAAGIAFPSGSSRPLKQQVRLSSTYKRTGARKLFACDASVRPLAKRAILWKPGSSEAGSHQVDIGQRVTRFSLAHCQQSLLRASPSGSLSANPSALSGPVFQIFHRASIMSEAQRQGVPTWNLHLQTGWRQFLPTMVSTVSSGTN